MLENSMGRNNSIIRQKGREERHNQTLTQTEMTMIHPPYAFNKTKELCIVQLKKTKTGKSLCFNNS